jgi:hypothetical protein
MHGAAPIPHKEIEIKLELSPADLTDLKKIPLLSGQADPQGRKPGFGLFRYQQAKAS